MYVIDIERENAQKFDSNGRFITNWGSKGSGDGEFSRPEDIAIDPKTGGVYITDTGNSPILIFGLVKSIEIENTVCN